MMAPPAARRIDRGSALGARPVRLTAVAAVERDNGGLLVTVRQPRPSWQRWLGGSEQFERAYGLDQLGREVYDACDGRTTVRAMVGRFARAHGIGRAEAEMAVTTFLKTMVARGMVAMAVSREKGR